MGAVRFRLFRQYRPEVEVRPARRLHPAILVADEPTGNLDEETGAQIADLLFAKQDERATTLLLVTHDTKLARRCGRVVRMRSGAIEPETTRRSAIAK